MRTLFLALIALPILAAPAAAENLACQTVNGRTTCVEGSGTLACRTVNGRTTCTHSPNQRVVCDTRDGQAACPGLPSLNGGVVVETRNGRVRVRTGTVDVDLDDEE